MPGGIVQNKALGQKICGCAASRCQLGLDRFECFRFRCAAFIVETVEFFREFRCAGSVFREEEFDDLAGDVHSAGGVDAWREAKAYFDRGWCTVDRDLSDLHESAQAGLYGIAKFAETQ